MAVVVVVVVARGLNCAICTEQCGLGHLPNLAVCVCVHFCRWGRVLQEEHATQSAVPDVPETCRLSLDVPIGSTSLPLVTAAAFKAL